MRIFDWIVATLLTSELLCKDKIPKRAREAGRQQEAGEDCLGMVTFHPPLRTSLLILALYPRGALWPCQLSKKAEPTTVVPQTAQGRTLLEPITEKSTISPACLWKVSA